MLSECAYICTGNIRPEVESFFRKIYDNLSNYEFIFDCFGYWFKPNNADFPRVPCGLNKVKYIDLGNDESVPLSSDEFRVALYLQEQLYLLIKNKIPATNSKITS